MKKFSWLLLSCFLIGQAHAIQFNFMSLIFSSKNIKNFGSYRAYKNGSYAKSCNEYINPVNGYQYGGEIGDGVYRIKPDSGAAFDVYCDMTTNGGGWTLVSKTLGGTYLPFQENLLSTVLPASSTGSRIAMFDKTNTIAFNNIRFSNDVGEYSYITFSSAKSFSSLNTAFSTYTNSNIVSGTVSSNIGSNCFLVRAQSGATTPFLDSSDYMYMGFAKCSGGVVVSATSADAWDNKSANPEVWGINGIKDSGSDPESSNVSLTGGTARISASIYIK